MRQARLRPAISSELSISLRPLKRPWNVPLGLQPGQILTCTYQSNANRPHVALLIDGRHRLGRAIQIPSYLVNHTILGSWAMEIYPQFFASSSALFVLMVPGSDGRDCPAISSTVLGHDPLPWLLIVLDKPLGYPGANRRSTWTVGWDHLLAQHSVAFEFCRYCDHFSLDPPLYLIFSEQSR